MEKEKILDDENFADEKEVESVENEKQGESKTVGSDSDILVEVIEHYEKIENSLDNMTALSLMICLGIGILVGGLACKSFFDFMR